MEVKLPKFRLKFIKVKQSLDAHARNRQNKNFINIKVTSKK